MDSLSNRYTRVLRIMTKVLKVQGQLISTLYQLTILPFERPPQKKKKKKKKQSLNIMFSLRERMMDGINYVAFLHMIHTSWP